jgi:hypothetical protein
METKTSAGLFDRSSYSGIIQLTPMNISARAEDVKPRANVAFLAAKGGDDDVKRDVLLATFGSAEEGILLRVLARPATNSYRLFALFRDHQPAHSLEIELLERDLDAIRVSIDATGVGCFSVDHSIDWSTTNVALHRQ